MSTTIRTDDGTRRKVMLALTLIAILALTACNTFRGVGRDVEAAGRGIEGAADTTSEAIDDAVD